MDKFWKWMKEKNYGTKYSLYSTGWECNNGDSDCELTNYTKQMLIGYMIEYLCEEISAYWSLVCKLPSSYDDIDSIYNNLKSQIESMEV